MVKRSKKSNKIRYKKIGGGSFSIGNRYIKPNQIFEADPDEIPSAFKDVVIALDEEKEKKAVKRKAKEDAEDKESAEYDLKHKGGGWYNIVNKDTGKILNESPLKKEDAEKYLKDL